MISLLQFLPKFVEDVAIFLKNQFINLQNIISN
jgi:hypothetical protein